MPHCKSEWNIDQQNLFGTLLSLLGLSSSVSRRKIIFHWLLRITLVTTGFSISLTYFIWFILQHTRKPYTEITVLDQFQAFRNVVMTIRCPILILMVFCKTSDISDVLHSLHQLSLESVEYNVVIKAMRRKAYISVSLAFAGLVLVDTAGWAHPYYTAEFYQSVVPGMHGGAMFPRWLRFVIWEVTVMVPFLYATLMQMLFALCGYLLDYSVDCFQKAVDARDDKSVEDKISDLIRFHGKLVDLSRTIQGHFGSFVAVAFVCDASVMLCRMASAHILSGQPDFGYLYITSALAVVLVVSLLPYIRVHHKEGILQEKLCDLLECAENDMGSERAVRKCMSLIHISQNRKTAMKAAGISDVSFSLIAKTFTMIITVSVVVPEFLPRTPVPCILPDYISTELEALIYNSSSLH